MRDLINRGAMLGPRMYVAGYGLYVADAPPRPGYIRPPGGRADNLKTKSCASSASTSPPAWTSSRCMPPPARIKTRPASRPTPTTKSRPPADLAHKYGKRLAVHSYGPDGARDAVRAGADSVEHATDMDDATIAEMARRGTFYVPTIDHNRWYAEHISIFGWDNEK